jgi:GT2 family glycosyltransferase
MLARGEVDEIIAVDDCSSDATGALLEKAPGVIHLRTPHNMGPGGARNLAAQRSNCDYIWFVDSDVIAAEDSARVLGLTLSRSRVSAVFGSYDDEPDASNFLSQYKNLVHHFYHQNAKPEATTFWAGCGAVLRRDFLAVGGFDVAKFPYPSVEDIELGYRLSDLGYLISFEPRLQGKHLKEWRFANLVHTEVFRRAIPWAALMFARKKLTDDLNVQLSERVKAVMSALLLLVILGWIAGLLPWAWPVIALFCAGAANYPLIAFFVRRHGLLFAVRAFLFHQFYYLYSSASYVFAWVKYKASPRG